MDRWVKAGIVDTRFEGDRVAQALKEAEIPFLIKSFYDTAYDGLYVLQKGWGAVLVPQEFCEQTEAVIVDIKKTFEGEGRDEIDERE
ncbi:MAG: hypothetical protein A2162_11760 [Deltaproteobacteria bacterium RBG_13_52_11b]|nr:MAG: hypothetical protein A2162_11760 [Deltaproteobacteria bacterium RBG_13_52_11b]